MMYMGMIVLQTAINDWIVRMIDRIDTYMINFIWERGWNGRGEVLWDDMIPLAMALGAVLSLFLVGKIAYRTMTLKQGIDFMKLWKPLAVVFILSNWYIVTWTIFSFTQPIESYFRAGFESQNAKVIALQNRRMAAANKLDAINREKMAEAMTGETMENEALKNLDVYSEETNKGLSVESEHDILISTYGDLYYDMKDMPKDAEGNEAQKFDATTEVLIAGAQSWIEKLMLYIAEFIWATMVLVIFLVRAFFMSVLVMFGPVYMATSVLSVWEDAWQQWFERYIAVCFLGAAAYLALIFAAQIIVWGVHTDVMNWESFTASDAAWYEWVLFSIERFIGSAGVYIVALLVGMGVIGAVFELATYFYPSQMLHSAAYLYDDIWGTGKHYTTLATRKVYGGAKDAVQKTTGKMAADRIDDKEKKAEKKLDLGVQMGPEGKMRDGRTTGEFRGTANTYKDYKDSSTERMDTGTAAAHRWADRIWQRKVSEDTEMLRSASRMAAAQQDLDEFLKAQQDGKADEFIKAYKQRMEDNAILMQMAADGKAGINHFHGKDKLRDDFLKRYGLLEAYKKAAELQKKAEDMKPGRNLHKRQVQRAYFEAAENLNKAIAEKVREILAARGIVRDRYGEPEWEEPENQQPDTHTEETNERHSHGSSRNDSHNDDMWIPDENAGSYRIKEGDRDYDKVKELMQEEWFRKLSARRRNRQLLQMTLAAYERALREGRAEQFIRDMKRFGRVGDRMDDDMAIHPFDNVDIGRNEYDSIWDRLRDTDRLRKINEALDAIERANSENNKANDEETNE